MLNVRGLLVMSTSSGFANKPLEMLFLSCVIKTVVKSWPPVSRYEGPVTSIIIICDETVGWSRAFVWSSALTEARRLIEEPRISLVWDCWWFVWERDVRRPQIQSDQIPKKLINLQKLKISAHNYFMSQCFPLLLWKTAYISAL